MTKSTKVLLASLTLMFSAAAVAQAQTEAPPQLAATQCTLTKQDNSQKTLGTLPLEWIETSLGWVAIPVGSKDVAHKKTLSGVTAMLAPNSLPGAEPLQLGAQIQDTVLGTATSGVLSVAKQENGQLSSENLVYTRTSPKGEIVRFVLSCQSR
jgi:hypothetical protein